jgi:hypothetical protein
MSEWPCQGRRLEENLNDKKYVQRFSFKGGRVNVKINYKPSEDL